MNRKALGALAAYCCVVIALTMCKAFFRIGYLWDPANQRRRGLSLQPLAELHDAQSWFAPLFGYGGNIAFFIPVGVLAYVAFRDARWAVLFGFGLSLAVETGQYIFSLGYSDIDDLLMNTVGTLVGVGIARACGPRLHTFWIMLGYVVPLCFLGLVLAGERLGDPSKVTEVY
ncbi:MULTISPECIES: VanZ family protein [Corynebacterium]|uniref:VanZ family protein n=1 Tax=Corynebacterium lipophilum TaxID=2804918 RepID=A0AAW5HVX1_9CORY|nr:MULTISPECIES: VanZ family protein [Corynebacterium]MCO6394942.1 VanZ family protein [Corynebacterium lipophilum]MCQ4608151.1 VanZ family protein [Corynebacterium pseudogenitalium]MCQ4616346.1 VanZ family protein [Corynebacterium pseudogenitalium]MCZ2117645.1 VanZ family protein [Corynebacterium lipophilum]